MRAMFHTSVDANTHANNRPHNDDGLPSSPSHFLFFCFSNQDEDDGEKRRGSI
jgi:hypothetical protein